MNKYFLVLMLKNKLFTKKIIWRGLFMAPIFCLLLFSPLETSANLNYGAGYYTNLCGSGTAANFYSCSANCNPATGDCSGNYVVKWTCDGNTTDCRDNESAWSSYHKVDSPHPGCNKTVQIDVFSKNCRAGGGWSCGDSDLLGYMVWYSGDCDDPTSEICPSAPSSYPANKWDRVWCSWDSNSNNFKNKLQDFPYESDIQFGEKSDIHNNWRSGSVGNIKNDNIGFRSGRTINVSTAGTYKFTLGSDDGIRFWVDNVLLINKWYPRGYTINTVNVDLNAGNHALRLDYFEYEGGARVSFGYELASPEIRPFSVLTNSAESISPNSAKLAGTLTDLGGADSVNVWFEWGTTTNYGNETIHQVKNSTGIFNETITGLDPNTIYYFRATASKSGKK